MEQVSFYVLEHTSHKREKTDFLKINGVHSFASAIELLEKMIENKSYYQRRPDKRKYYDYNHRKELIISATQAAYEASKRLPISEATSLLKCVHDKVDKCLDLMCQAMSFDPDNIFSVTKKELKKEINQYKSDYISNIRHRIKSITDLDDDVIFMEYQNDLLASAESSIVNERKVKYEKELKIYEELRGLKSEVFSGIRSLRSQLTIIEESRGLPETKDTLGEFCLHDNPDEVYEVIGNLIFNKKGKRVAAVIDAFCERGLIRVGNGEYARFYNALRNELGVSIGTDQAINKYLIRYNNTKTQRDEIESIKRAIIDD